MLTGIYEINDRGSFRGYYDELRVRLEQKSLHKALHKALHQSLHKAGLNDITPVCRGTSEVFRSPQV